MSSQTAIEWTHATWNPVTGCSKVSPGCAHCYAETFADRWRGVPGHAYEQGFDLRLWPERLESELLSRQPAWHRELHGHEQPITHQAMVLASALEGAAGSAGRTESTSVST